MIAIDFVAGSHGHYLEYVTNRFVAGIESDFSPFNQASASHTRPADYYDRAVFVAAHYYEQGVPDTPRIVRIVFDTDDLLPLSSVSLHRAGDYGIDNNLLEQDTYHKLKNIDYEYLIARINLYYPEAGISEHKPDCARYILREYFKFGFKTPEHHGIMSEMRRLDYTADRDIFDFALTELYDADQYLARMQELNDWYGGTGFDTQSLLDLHGQFLDRQPYRSHKLVCDGIVADALDGTDRPLPALTLFQESYVNGRLEAITGIEMPFYQPQYFTTTGEIHRYLVMAKLKLDLDANF